MLLLVGLFSHVAVQAPTGAFDWEISNSVKTTVDMDSINDYYYKKASAKYTKNRLNDGDDSEQIGKQYQQHVIKASPSKNKTILISTFDTLDYNQEKTSKDLVINYSRLNNEYLNECQSMSKESFWIQINKANFQKSESVFCAVKLFRKEHCSHFSQYVRVHSDEFENDEWIKNFDEPFASYQIGCSNIYMVLDQWYYNFSRYDFIKYGLHTNKTSYQLEIAYWEISIS